MKRTKRGTKLGLRKKDIDPNAIPRQYFVGIAILLIVSWLIIGYIIRNPVNKQTFKRRNLKNHERQIVFPPPKSKFGMLILVFMYLST